MAHRFALLAVLASAIAAPSPASASTVAVREAQRAYASPSFDARPTGRLPARAPLTLLERQQGTTGAPWVKLTFRKTTGWVPEGQTRRAPTPRCRSRATGSRSRGGLVCGKRLAPDTELWATQNPLDGAYPNAPARRWGADAAHAGIEAVALAYWRRFPLAPRVVIGDLSARNGGRFGIHATHQQGLDVDVYYPSSRPSGARYPRTPRGPADIHRTRAQWLVERFADENAAVVFIGVQGGLRPTRRNIRHLGSGHETHFHVQFRR